MKRYISFFFLVAIPIFLFSQSNTKIDFYTGIDYSGIYGIDNDRGTFIKSIERGKVNFNFGINYNQLIRKKIWLKTGIGFTSLGEQTKSFENVVTINNKVSYHFLEIPFVLRFEFSKKKITPFFETGLSTMYYLQTRDKKCIENSKTVENYRDENIQNIQISLNLGFGVSHSINKKLEIFLQTSIRCHLSKLENSNSDEYLWGSGLITGTRLKF